MSGDRRLGRGNPRLAGLRGIREDKSRIGVINDSGVINCGLH